MKYKIQLTRYLLASYFLTSFIYASDLDKLRETHHCPYGNLKGCKLNGWNLPSSNLEGADLEGADLRGANLRGANLKGAKLEGANLYGADLSGAQGIEGLRLPNLSLLQAPGRIHRIQTGTSILDLRDYGPRDIAYFSPTLSFLSPSPINAFALGYLHEIYGDNPEIAYEFYKQAANEGVREAMNNLGWMCENGYGLISPDRGRAERHYEDAQDGQGHFLPMAKFNFRRIVANYSDDPGAQYCLAKAWAKGPPEAVSHNIDLAQAILYYEKAAEKGHPQAAYELGRHYYNGLGVPKDYREAYKWFKEAAIGKHQLDAMVMLGRMHEFGQYVVQDLTQAFKWYNKAAMHDDQGALAKVGDFYAKGVGVTQDLEEARKSYHKAAVRGKVSALYNAGRMCELLAQAEKDAGAEQEAKKYYMEAKKYYEDAVAKECFEALFNLASLYERGRGVEQDLRQAISLYEEAELHEHANTSAKLVLLRQQPDAPIDILEEVGRFSGMTAAWIRAELGQDYEIIYEGAPLYSLSEDFQQAMGALTKYLQELPQEGRRLNHMLILQDPYLKAYLDMNFDDISDEEISLEAFRQIQQDLERAYNPSHPAYTEDLASQLPSLFEDKLLHDNQEALRRIFLRVYNRIIQQEGQGEPLEEGTVEVVHGDAPEAIDADERNLQYRQGTAAALFLQNNERCADGFSEFLQEKLWSLTFEGTRGRPLGFHISKVITNYKRHFLQLHRNPLPGAHEEATEAGRLLEERVRLPLGLPQIFNHPTYPTWGEGEDTKYSPSKVIKRFFKGGTLHFSNSDSSSLYTEVPPLTVKALTELIMNASLQKKEIPTEALIEFARQDLFCLPKLSQAFEEFEENDFFDPHNSPNPYKPAFFEYILMRHGYLTD
ncbi:pentapeptide repeat-containing protein [Candidatus Odyssella acanthamoebae]|uniref:pentapeptide repeat-containing protein n=1 Tax=Candidatus Odyssella acanthamoebae TaxID=91604 RepID=UPI0006913502|nr:pentapeptide repeat-containing protein [Candidatus Paracaedibacter acanthamoebae]